MSDPENVQNLYREQFPQLLAGNFFGRNFGDDLMLAGYLIDQNPSLCTVLAQVLPKSEPAEFEGVSFKKWSIAEGVRSIRAHTRFVQVGGTHLQYLSSHSRTKQIRVLLAWLTFVLCARIFQKEVAFVSVGVGPFESRFARQISRLIIRLASSITVRDQESQVLLAQFNRDAELVEDLAMHFLRARGKVPVKKLEDGFRVVCAPSFENFDFDWWSEELIGLLRSRPGVEFSLLASGRQQDGGDLPVLKQLERCIHEISPSTRVTFTVYDGNIRDFISVFDGAGLVLAARYHAALVAKALDLPLVVNHYHPKVKHALKVRPIVW